MGRCTVIARVCRTFKLQSAHRLPNVPEGHRCRRTHGHTWYVDVWVVGEVDARLGWVVDYADIDAAWESAVKPELDHVDLCDVMDNPTTELLCIEIAVRLRPHLPGLYRIVARENGESAVEVEFPLRSEPSLEQPRARR